MIILDVDQGSDEWFKARAGIPTASSFDKIITSTGKPSTQAKTYSNKLVAEYIIGDKINIDSNEWMQRGVELEPEAREYYEFQTDSEVKEVGLIYKDENKLVSCSPDGIMGDRGLEIKCPAPHTQIEYLLNDRLPSKYIAQVQGSMWVTGFKQWDFLSYHPDLPPLLITVHADKEFHGKLNILVDNFIEKMLENRDKVSARL